MLDLIVRGGLVSTPTATLPLDIGVKDGRVALLAAPGSIGVEAAHVEDATGCHVVPGGIDAHVHFSFAATATMHAQSAAAGTRAAAFGGTTTVIDFAWQRGSESLLAAIDERKAVFAAERPHVDYAFHAMMTGAITFEALEEIPEAIGEGVSSFKTFTTFSGASASGSLHTDDGRIWGVMQQAARHGGMTMVHCEDDCLIDFHVRGLYREGREHGSNIAEARPSIVEEAAVARMLLLARRSGSPLYVVHVSTIEAAEAIAEARGRHLPVYGEVLHNQLVFTGDAYHRHNGLCFHNYPPLKSPADRDALWAGLLADLSTTASDDYTVPLAEKLSGQRVDNLTGGHNGVETRMGVLWSEGVAKGRLSVDRFVELTSSGPAKVFGLYPQKGALLPGCDADIVVLDPALRQTLTLGTLHSDCDYSVWDGWECNGYPRTTIARGAVLVRDGAWVGPQHRGRFVRCGVPAGRA